MAGTLADTRDLSTVPDLSAHGKEVTGGEAVAERLYDRLTTDRGTYPWWRNYGTNVRLFLLAKTPLWRVEQAVKLECEKDAQVLSALVEATYSQNGQQLDIAVSFTTKTGTFTFTMTANEAAANYVSLSKAA